eukprot:TRINITY_DN27825_c0_g1_i1.p1 TRINITY_DN27825_c0_g1~~TRINITY_DN27825_c0_g1_i1.p1  ORF type:complete len:664 (+),score=248.53 TRINITY_DN27825_c0_g1_i1:99-2090(+)
MSGGQREAGGDLPGGAGKGRAVIGKPKNKVAGNMQITAEQLLLEARDRTEQEPFRPRSKLYDKDELMEYRNARRSEYEKLCQRNRMLLGNWTKYAKWEEDQGEFTRARSVFERAMDAIPNNHSLYQRYAEMEMRAGNVQHARNVWLRATKQLPRVDALWLKRVHLEETVGDVEVCRQVYREWMDWRPKQEMWHLFAKFEIRFKEVQKAREVVADMVTFFNDVSSWLYYSRFEEKHGKIAFARRIYEQAIDNLSERASDIDKIFVEFAKFEERQQELDRARGIYRIALDRITKDQAPELYETYLNFEKQYGEREGIEQALVSRKRFEYQQEIERAPENYDVWFNYIRMTEGLDDPEQTRELYERAVANIPTVPKGTPPHLQKQYWGRYLYLWLMYAQYEELDMKDAARARQVYHQARQVVPHEHFSFSKLWIACAEFEIRCGSLDAARALMGEGLGRNPTSKMYRWYIALEHQLGNIERVRALYTSWLRKKPEQGAVWVKFAELELAAHEPERARELFQQATSQDVLEEPELVWKRFIASEVRQKSFDTARSLYRQLADKTKHVQVFLSWADMEFNEVGNAENARGVYEEADNILSVDPAWQQEWHVLLEAWLAFEKQHGTPSTISKVNEKLHPETAQKQPSKLLMKARAHKRQKMLEEQGEGR